MSKLYRWTGANLKWMRENIHLTDEQMARELGTNLYRVRAARKRHGILKDHCGHFKPGNKPHNKGATAPWAKTDACKRGHFKPGQNPHNTRDIGTIWKRKEGRVEMWVTKTETGIQYLHRWLWQQHNGPIPPKHQVQFIDGNYDNVVIENLRCIPFGQAARDASLKCDRKDRARKIWATRRLKEAMLASKPYNILA